MKGLRWLYRGRTNACWEESVKQFIQLPPVQFEKLKAVVYICSNIQRKRAITESSRRKKKFTSYLPNCNLWLLEDCTAGAAEVDVDETARVDIDTFNVHEPFWILQCNRTKNFNWDYFLYCCTWMSTRNAVHSWVDPHTIDSLFFVFSSHIRCKWKSSQVNFYLNSHRIIKNTN